jgi:hypothetical protein
MSLGSFLRRWFRRPDGRRVRLDRLLAARPRVEHLEDRCVPTALPSGIAVFQPSSATWYLHNTPTPGAPDATPFAYGGGNWIPVAGDWNGDGQPSIGVYDPSTATWYLKNDNNPGTPSVTPFRYGAPGWIPVVGDWSGSGHDGIGVFDPGTGTWYLRNETSAGAPDAGQFRYGGAGWLPVVGDWNGNGATTVGVVDPTTETWYIKNSNSSGAPDIAPFRYGAPGWLPVAGDWDGNGTTTIGVFDPSSAAWYLKNSNSLGAPDIAPFAYGGHAWAPLALHNQTSQIPPPGGTQAPQIVLQVPLTTAGNGFTASVTVLNDPAVNASTAFSLDVDLNHDGRFDGPGESGYATGTLNGQRSGQVTVGGLVAGSYRVQAHFVDPGTGATVTSRVQTVRLTTPPAGPVPVSFEQNMGQTDSQVSYLARAAGGQTYFTEQGVVLTYLAPDNSSSGPSSGQNSGGQDSGSASTSQPGQLPGDQGGGGTPPPPMLEIAERVQFQGGNASPLITAEGQQGNVSNYLIGNDPSQWHTNVPNFQQVTYHAIYPGIDAVFHGNASTGLEFDFHVAPGADPSQIVLSFPDVSGVTVTADGQLQLVTSAGNINVAAPVVYQTGGAVGTFAIRSSFTVRGTNLVGFTLGQYDHSAPLIIDPIVTGATYLGGSGNEELAGITPPIVTPTASAMTSDSAGNIFLTGSTTSTNYPVTTGVFQAANKGKTDAFVTKMNGQGTALAWSTYLGGTNDESGYGVTVDTGDDAYVVGGTTSTDFPTTTGVFQTTNKASGANKNGFVTKLNAQGTALVYSTYIGGAKNAQENSIAVDLGGDAYVTGIGGSDFPTTPGAFQPTFAATSTNNGVLTKLNAQGTALVYSTFYTGFFASTPSQVLVDSLGQAVIGGSSFSSDLPMTPGAFQTTYGGGLSDGFVAKFNPAGSKLLWATYVGGPDTDFVESITGDTSGNIYATGYELFGSGGFPTTPGVLQTSPKGGQDAIVFKLSADGRKLLYSTYLGGSKDDRGLGIALDAFGNAYVTGTTLSNDFPTTANAIQSTNKGGILSGDVFLVQLNSVANSVVYGSYMGGAKDDYGESVQLGPSLLYMAGTTSSTDFPIVTGAFQSANAGGDDVWVSAVDQLVPAGGFGSPGFAGSSVTTGPGPGGTGGGGGSGGILNGLSDDRFERNDTSDQATQFGTLAAGSETFTALTINLHADGTVDQDWYQFSPTQAGTLTVSVNNIVSNGDLWLRLFKVNSNGTLSEIGNSTLTGGFTTQQAAVAVNAGDQIDAWVFGYNFALGFYSLTLSLA